MSRPVITIDGPAGAGKSTAARILAGRLGLRYLDTGALYRLAAWKAAREGLGDPREIAAMIRRARFTAEGGRATCDGEDPGPALRTPEITAAVRPIAGSPECRAEMVRLQREAAAGGGLVTEGRDQGSVVFPDADRKFYLDASLEVRAGRRWREQGGDREAVRAAIERRDAEDRARLHGPLVRPEGAVVIDTSALTVEDVVARMAASLGFP